MDAQTYYKSLKLPPLAPPTWAFGTVWPILYAIIFISYGNVLFKAIKGEVSWLFTLPFAINLIANYAFTYFQFGLKNNYLAAADALIMWITIIITIILLWHNYRALAYWQIPYFVWVSFASYLQISIAILNK